jgi:hypothetical protein
MACRSAMGLRQLMDADAAREGEGDGSVVASAAPIDTSTPEDTLAAEPYRPLRKSRY